MTPDDGPPRLRSVDGPGGDGDDDPPFYDEATELRIAGAGARRSTRRVAGVRKASGVGAVLTGIALGLQEVFYPDQDEEIVLVVDASGEPDDDHPVALEYDPTSVSRSRAHARLWLIEGDG